MKILITGGAGYLGGALTDILLKTNHEIRVYDALMYEDDYLKPAPVEEGVVEIKNLFKEG